MTVPPPGPPATHRMIRRQPLPHILRQQKRPILVHPSVPFAIRKSSQNRTSHRDATPKAQTEPATARWAVGSRIPAALDGRDRSPPYLVGLQLAWTAPLSRASGTWLRPGRPEFIVAGRGRAIEPASATITPGAGDAQVEDPVAEALALVLPDRASQAAGRLLHAEPVAHRVGRSWSGDGRPWTRTRGIRAAAAGGAAGAGPAEAPVPGGQVASEVTIPPAPWARSGQAAAWPGRAVMVGRRRRRGTRLGIGLRRTGQV